MEKASTFYFKQLSRKTACIEKRSGEIAFLSQEELYNFILIFCELMCVTNNTDQVFTGGKEGSMKNLDLAEHHVFVLNNIHNRKSRRHSREEN